MKIDLDKKKERKKGKVVVKTWNTHTSNWKFNLYSDSGVS
jgi:hypothetical protein